MRWENMKRIVAAMSVTIMGACASTTPQVDTTLGEAVSAARVQQTSNPEAGANLRPVVGIEGTPAKEAIGRYYDSFKAPPPTFEVFFGTGAANGR